MGSNGNSDTGENVQDFISGITLEGVVDGNHKRGTPGGVGMRRGGGGQNGFTRTPTTFALQVRCFTLLHWKLNLSYVTHTLFPERKATLMFSFFPVPLGFRPWSRFIANGLESLKLNSVHSSPKERQLQKSCISFGEEHISHFVFTWRAISDFNRTLLTCCDKTSKGISFMDWKCNMKGNQDCREIKKIILVFL